MFGSFKWESMLAISVKAGIFFIKHIANMLRYAHHMPAEYENAFLAGLQNNGFQLPENWQTSVFLLNLLSLLDCLIHCPPEKRPNQCADICCLITLLLNI